MTDTHTLETLAHRLRSLKASEAAIKAERQAVETEIVALTGLRTHGQKTVPAGPFKLTVKPNYGYSMDWSAWQDIAAQIPVELHPTKTKVEVDEVKVRALRDSHPDLYVALAFALTVKPQRPSVEIAEAA